MSAIGLPDYQRGVASAQLLLASPAAGASVVTVGVPPNAETIVVMIQGGVGANVISCVGVTTGIGYIGALAVGSTEVPAWTTIFFDVAQAVDKQVQIKITTPPAAKWYVYADAATHISMDPTKVSNNIGQQYVVPVVPSTLTGDHPPNELSLVSPNLAATGNILAGPGTGLRYRVFSVQMSCVVAGVFGVVTDLASGAGLAWIAGVGNTSSSIPAQGYPLNINAALHYALLAGAGSVGISVYYTTETA